MGSSWPQGTFRRVRSILRTWPLERRCNQYAAELAWEIKQAGDPPKYFSKDIFLEGYANEDKPNAMGVRHVYLSNPRTTRIVALVRRFCGAR